jgi:hypothetical protein
MSTLFCKICPQLCCCYYCLYRLVQDLHCCVLDTRVLSVQVNNISVIIRVGDSFQVTREGQQTEELYDNKHCAWKAKFSRLL